MWNTLGNRKKISFNQQNKEGKMKKLLSVMFILAIILTPVASYADTAAESVPPQVLKHGYVTPALQEPATADWVNGKGRKDWVIRWATADNYLKKATGMLLRGTSNAGLGAVDVLTYPINSSIDAPLGIGTAQGLLLGPIVAAMRVSSGALDVATFWIPFWHGIPMKKPVLGLHDVHNYGVIGDATEYNHQTKRYFFNKASNEY